MATDNALPKDRGEMDGMKWRTNATLCRVKGCLSKEALTQSSLLKLKG